MSYSSWAEAVFLLAVKFFRVIVHCDRGGHYRWPGWIKRMEARGLARSMSRKGYTPDNAACKVFFGLVKSELHYGRSWTNVKLEAFMGKLDEYIRWYNETRIKMSLGARSPVECRT